VHANLINVANETIETEASNKPYHLAFKVTATPTVQPNRIMTNMTLKQNIQNDMKAAMKAKDSQRLLVIRTLMAAIKQKEIDEQIELDDTQVLAVIDKMLKQRQDSINQFAQANRQDLIDKETAEAAILQTYLPPQLDQTEIEKMIAQTITETGAAGMQDMGKVMGILKPQLQGRADMGAVSKLIKDKLS
jgi:uncharacterized protein YqeY